MIRQTLSSTMPRSMLIAAVVMMAAMVADFSIFQLQRTVIAFTTPTAPTTITTIFQQRQHQQPKSSCGVLFLSKDADSNEIVARRITLTGDVQGGYYRSCVLNEAGRFRRLVGTMTPPDDTDRAEIYVEGKRKMVDGFVRWCKKGDVGLSQVVHVEDVHEEEPTGLYDEFYMKVKDE